MHIKYVGLFSINSIWILLKFVGEPGNLSYQARVHTQN